MESAWDHIHPKDSYCVKMATPLTNIDQKVITFLYQPIIEKEAYSLYMTMWSELSDFESETAAMLHADLITSCNLELPKLYLGRLRLEGIGLLRTYEKQKNGNQTWFLYELQPPLSAAAFFKDEILSLLLIEAVGERRYQSLLEKFSNPKVNTEEFLEITKKFLDVFQFQPAQLAQYEKILESSRSSLNLVEPRQPVVDDKSFNWTFFMGLLDGLYVDKNQIESELKELIFSLHQLYNIDELAMLGYINESADTATNKVAKKTLKGKVLRDYHQKKPQKLVALDKEIELLETPTEKSQFRKNSLKLEGFSDGEVQVILVSEQYAPLEFLREIKEEKNGFVSPEERWCIENIRKQSGLPDSVINVMIHYILVGKENSTIRQSFANTIANDWAQNKVYTPEGAMKKAKDLLVSASESNTKKQQSRVRTAKNIRKETLPEWANDPQKEESSLSPNEKAKLEARIKKLSNNMKEGE